MVVRGTAPLDLKQVSFPTHFFYNLVLPCLSTEVESGSLTRLGSARLLPENLRNLQSAVPSSLNPEGIYVWPPLPRFLWANLLDTASRI